MILQFVAQNNHRHCDGFTVSLCQARNQRQLGRPVMQTAIDPGHRRAHENGGCRWAKLTHRITLHACSLRTEMLCVCVYVKLRAASEYEERKMIRAAIRQIRDEQQQGEWGGKYETQFEDDAFCLCVLAA